MKSDGKNIRKKFRHCGKYGVSSPFAQVSYYQVKEERKQASKAGWQRKHEVPIPKYRALNNKRSVRYLEALIQSNFLDGGLLASLSYSNEHLPENEQAAKQKVHNYIRRVNRRLKKMGKENAKWIAITEVGKNGRIHHHLLIKCDLDRDELEKLWGLGYANTRRLQPDKKLGLLPVVQYIGKEFIDDDKPRNRRNWDSSHNLVRPWETINDNPRMMSKKKFNKMQDLPEDSEEMKKIIEGDNPNYELINVEKTYIEELGQWFFFCRLRLKEKNVRNVNRVNKTVDKKT